MVAETAHGVLLDVCPNCGGIWLNGDELKGVLASDPNTIAGIEATVHPHVEQRRLGPSRLFCPDNNVPLDEYHYMYNSPVLIHSCTVCGGMFIHADELPLMQQWFEKSHQPPTRDEALRIGMGQDIAEHEEFMLRQQHLAAMFGTLRSYRPGWWGLL
jgi:Zn-finger nucleic acid-binding protein